MATVKILSVNVTLQHAGSWLYSLPLGITNRKYPARWAGNNGHEGVESFNPTTFPVNDLSNGATVTVDVINRRGCNNISVSQQPTESNDWIIQIDFEHATAGTAVNVNVDYYVTYTPKQVPIANPNAYTFDMDSVRNGTGFVINDETPGSHHDKWILNSLPANGTMENQPSDGASFVPVIAGNEYEFRAAFTPDPGWSGVTSFSYYITDQEGERSNNTTVTITVPAGIVPLALDDHFTYGFESGENNCPFVANNDSAPAGTDIDKWQIVSLPQNGTITNAPTSSSPRTPMSIGRDYNGHVFFTANPGWSGTTSFRYVLLSSSGARSRVATVTITVSAAPAGPWIASPKSYFSIQDRPINISNYKDNDSRSLPQTGSIVVEFTKVPSNGVLRIVRATDVSVDDALIATAGIKVSVNLPVTLIFEPNDGFLGGDTINYRYVCTGGTWSQSATVTLSFSIQAPVPNPGSACTSNSCVGNRAVGVLGPIGQLAGIDTEPYMIRKASLDTLRIHLETERAARHAHGKITLGAFDSTYDSIDTVEGSDFDKIKATLNDMVSTDPAGFPDSTTIGINAIYDGGSFRQQLLNIVAKLNELRADCICNGDCGANSWCACHGHCNDCSDY